MTTCPGCGRVADDEIVCAGCGMSLAAARDGSESSTGLMDELGFGEARDTWTGDVRTWRVAAFVGLTCALAVATAIVLLQQGGTRNADVGLPLTSAPSGSGVFTPLPSFGLPTTTATSTSGHPSHPATRTSTASPTRTTTASRDATTTAAPAPSSSGSSSTAPATTASVPHTTSPVPTTSAPATSSTPATPTVRLAKGSSCGHHCYRLDVTLSGFASGSHQIACWSSHAGMFASYSTSANASANCQYDRMHDSVWVVVDSTYHSNTVSW